MPIDEQNQIAVPYIPPPPPIENSPQKQKVPFINGMIVAVVILLVGFMSYNFIGHQLTQLAGISSERVTSPTPIPPSDTPIPPVSSIPSLSVAPSISLVPSISSSPAPSY